MAQILDVSIIPQSYLPEIRVSENDNLLRVIKTNIIDETGEAYTIPSGVTATFAGTKPSGLGFTIPCTIDGNAVQFVMEDTACNEVGRFPAEIRFMNGDSRIGTCNVLMVVEPNPHPDDTTDGDREPLINEITALLEEIQEEHQQALQDIGAAKDDALDAIAADVQAADAAAQRAQESADQAAESEARTDTAMEAWTNMSAEAETLPAGSDATADYNEGVLSLGIPRGDKGEQGEDGQDGTDGVGIASVALNSDYTLTITLTDGRAYTTTSIRGEQGETGLTPDFSIGTVTTLAPGSQATATITGTDEEPVLNLGIPKGDPGEVTEADLLKLAVHDEASGSIASFTDGSDGFPMDSLKVTLEPVQDLHGYDKPWAGGAGANLWQPYSATNQGVSFDVNDDGTIHIHGTTTGSSWLQGIKDVPLADLGLSVGDTIYGYSNGNTSSEGKFMSLIRFYNGSTYLNQQISGEGSMAIPSGTDTIRLIMYGSGRNGNPEVGTVIDQIGYFELGQGSTIPSEWTPYSNISPISGHDEVGVSVVGKNLLKNTVSSSSSAGVTYTVNDDKTISLSGTATSNVFIVLSDPYYLSSGNYTMKKSGNANIQMLLRAGTAAGSSKITATTNDVTSVIDGGTYVGVIRVASGTNTDGITLYPQIELGSTATDYEPYQGRTITTTLPQTVYGGTLDVVTGELVVTWATTEKQWSQMSVTYVGDTHTTKSVAFAEPVVVGSGNSLTNFTTRYEASTTGQFVHYYIGSNQRSVFCTLPNELVDMDIQICGQPVNPHIYQLTPTEIDTLLGQNNVWSDSGEVYVLYPADTKLYILKVIQ